MLGLVLLQKRPHLQNVFDLFTAGTAASSKSREGTPAGVVRSREGSRRGAETPKKKESEPALPPPASRDGGVSPGAPPKSREGTPASILPSRDGASPAAPRSRGASPGSVPPKSRDGTSPAPPPKSRDGTPASKTKLEGLSAPELSISVPVLLIIGAPGAQKSEVARRVADKYEGFLLLSMGVLLRTKVKAESEDELWFRVARKMDQGEPVPMKLCRELLYNQLQVDGEAKRGLIIEGYPRTEAQLTDLRNVLGRIDLAILIDCTEQFCMDNIAKRFEDGNGQRPDDSPNIVKTRMALFKQNTLPMLKSLDEKGILRVIEGDSQLDSVFNDVTTILDRELHMNEEAGGTEAAPEAAPKAAPEATDGETNAP
ncbi:hypothetical protein OESDEN_05226 [Oesophagostomum dentatum]|uniref:Adenylate kinase n=1 Tax=Oesophagostomum dentatum TaxID=61180 RepID=A0A0B1THE2_OESDE|nr:hypothetical protein OESDEN_05226 [Oesophagostomum dentatum]